MKEDLIIISIPIIVMILIILSFYWMVKSAGTPWIALSTITMMFLMTVFAFITAELTDDTEDYD